MGPLNQYLGHALQRARTAMFSIINRHLQAAGLNGGEFGAMIVIQRNPGLRFIDVTRALGFRETNFAPLIRGLEQRGLVIRRASKLDKRTKTLVLSPRGETIITAAVAIQTTFQLQLAARLGKSKTKLLHEALMAIATDEWLLRDSVAGDSARWKKTNRGASQRC